MLTRLSMILFYMRRYKLWYLHNTYMGKYRT